MEINNEKFYTVPEVAAMFNVLEMTVRTWIWDGKLEAVKVGQWRIPGDKLQAFIEAGRSKAAKQEG